MAPFNLVFKFTVDATKVEETEGPCVGNIAPIYRLNFTGLCIQNDPLALKQGTYSSVFPAGITIAATWDKNIAYERGSQMAAEFRGKGSQVLLGPVAGPLGRSGLGGRNWEGFSPDPYLTGELFTETILGTQDSGVQACAKHYCAAERSGASNILDGPLQNEDGTMIDSVSLNIDDRTMYELYFWPCQNSKALNGYVMLDWGAIYSGAFAINVGKDMDMLGTNLTESVKNGSVLKDRLDDMCRRDKDFLVVDLSNKELNTQAADEYKYNYIYGSVANVDVRGNYGAEIRKQAADGINALPLKPPKQLAVFGNGAGDFTNGMSVFYFNGVAGGGSGSGLFTYLASPLEATKQRAKFREKTLVRYVLNNSAIIEENSPYFAPIVPGRLPCLSESWATEGEDRTSLHSDWNGDEVVEKVTSTCSNTVAVTHSNGVNILPWADHPNVTAILAAHLPGQEAGSSIVDVLWGEVNPSGHLPCTIAKSEYDYSFAPIQNSTTLQNTNDPTAWQSGFEEGVLIDYRATHWESITHFDYYNKSVQYEFGYGLSYTTFSIEKDISLTPLFNGDLSALPADAKIIPGGNPNLWEALYRISITVRNTGEIGATKASPINVLRGFEKVYLQPGESRNVTFQLTRRDISH
ncbi:glycoside hydrolase family 3 C-terminal domain-containing protein [Aspergillus flavus]|uniref:Probable beta-glucosidase G n=1 Tax=Aspergillus flavus (strain ATCC 200026 / FGSC A1120 / IAM 13836 / NRRL 3357 / JCM 12722 / SRRC 167) TaxID=332952 RepID=A0A7U2R1L2_ASPFN|nr:glycoside hydrolase family 3 C-terminal domain-containing protein [Aspergillus flavus]